MVKLFQKNKNKKIKPQNSKKQEAVELKKNKKMKPQITQMTPMCS